MNNGFKEMLKYYRKRDGLSQEALAKKIGVTRSALANYEQGTRKPSYEILEALADTFNTSITALLGIDVDYLDENERIMIETYRGFDDNFKARMMAYMQALIDMKKEDK